MSSASAICCEESSAPAFELKGDSSAPAFAGAPAIWDSPRSEVRFTWSDDYGGEGG